MIDHALGWIASFTQCNEMKRCDDEFQKQLKIVRELQEKINLTKLKEIIEKTESLEKDIAATGVAIETLIKNDWENTKAQKDLITSLAQKTFEDCTRLSCYR